MIASEAIIVPAVSQWKGTFPDESFVMMIKYLEIRDIIRKLMMLNKRCKDLVQSENYLLFKHFLRNFNMLNDRLKRSEIPAKIPIMRLLRDNFSLRHRSPSSNIHPFCFYTDGGTFNDDTKYFINNIFSGSSVCHSTRSATNANI